MMNTALLALAVPVLALWACDESAPLEQQTEPTSESTATAKAAEPQPAPAPEAKAPEPLEMTAAEFFKDYDSLEGLELLQKYRSGLTVSGKVKRVFKEADGSTKAWLDANGGNWLSLSFADQGAALVEKKVKQGDELRAQCKVGGGTGKYIILNECALES